MLMDKAYEGNETRQLVLDLGMIPVVPPKSKRLPTHLLQIRKARCSLPRLHQFRPDRRCPEIVLTRPNSSGRSIAQLCDRRRKTAWRRTGSPRTGLRPWGGDTPAPVLAPGNGKTKTGRLWTYIRDDRPAGSLNAPAAWFAYSPNRRGEHPQRHLAKFQGILQADAFAGFDKLYEDGTIQEAPCMAHIRRKFYDLVEAHRSPIAIEVE